jgi:hypothetical protein
MAATHPVDFTVEYHGSIFLLRPVSRLAERWVDEHLPEEAPRWGNAVAVEHRYIADIVAGIRADGLGVR